MSHMKKELVSFVKQEIRRGTPKSTIIRMLAKKDYNSEEINEVIAAAIRTEVRGIKGIRRRNICVGALVAVLIFAGFFLYNNPLKQTGEMYPFPDVYLNRTILNSSIAYASCESDTDIKCIAPAIRSFVISDYYNTKFFNESLVYFSLKNNYPNSVYVRSIITKTNGTCARMLRGITIDPGKTSDYLMIGCNAPGARDFTLVINYTMSGEDSQGTIRIKA